MSVDDSTPQGIDRSRSFWAQSIGPKACTKEGIFCRTSHGSRGGISVKISLYFHVKIGFPIIIVQDFRKGPVTRTRNRASLLWNSASFLRNSASFLRNSANFLRNSASSLRNRASFLVRTVQCVGKHRKRFTQVLDLYPAINIHPLINLYPVIGENTLASHPSDGFLHFFFCSRNPVIKKVVCQTTNVEFHKWYEIPHLQTTPP
jgi:hypothetical protein